MVMSPPGVERIPCAPRWYFTSPLPPSSLDTTASIVRSPSNSRRIVSYGRPTTWARTFSRPRCAIPTTTSWAPLPAASSIGLVEHRDHHVEPLDGELLLAEEGAPQVALHPLDLAEAAEQPHALLARELPAVAARLDRLPQPDALLVVGDVLDLVRDRAGVRLAQPRQRVGERLALDVEAEERGGDARLQLRRQLRDQPLGLEGGIAGRLRAERVEMRGEVTVHPDRLDERHRRGDPAEELLVGRRCRRRRCSGRRRRRGVSVPVGGRAFEEPRQTGLPLQQYLGLALEQVAPLLRHGAGVVEVLLEEQRGVARVQPVDVGMSHVRSRCSSAGGATRAAC